MVCCRAPTHTRKTARSARGKAGRSFLRPVGGGGKIQPSSVAPAGCDRFEALATSILIDCEVMQADGGTRTASSRALGSRFHKLRGLGQQGLIAKNSGPRANGRLSLAVIVDGTCRLDSGNMVEDAARSGRMRTLCLTADRWGSSSPSHSGRRNRLRRSSNG